MGHGVSARDRAALAEHVQHLKNLTGIDIYSCEAVTL
jgi:hypothetical protein